MLHPSYSELIDVLNSDSDNDNQVTSRYTIVIAAAKRARQLVDGAQKVTKYSGNDKAVSIAVNEMAESKIKVKMNAQAQQENRDSLANDEIFKNKADEKVSLSLNFDNFDDNDELDDYDDFADEEEIKLDDSRHTMDLSLEDDIDDELDDDSFDDDSEDEDDYKDDAFDNEDSYDDDDDYDD